MFHHSRPHPAHSTLWGCSLVPARGRCTLHCPFAQGSAIAAGSRCSNITFAERPYLTTLSTLPSHLLYPPSWLDFPIQELALPNMSTDSFKDLFLHLRERQRGIGRGEEGKNLQVDSLLSMEPNVGLSPTVLRSRPVPKPRVRHSTN